MGRKRIYESYEQMLEHRKQQRRLGSDPRYQAQLDAAKRLRLERKILRTRERLEQKILETRERLEQKALRTRERLEREALRTRKRLERKLSELQQKILETRKQYNYWLPVTIPAHITDFKMGIVTARPLIGAYSRRLTWCEQNINSLHDIKRIDAENNIDNARECLARTRIIMYMCQMRVALDQL